jgi:hypothetical protein
MKVSHICPKCGGVIRGMRCPGCGHEVLPEVPRPLGKEGEEGEGIPEGPPEGEEAGEVPEVRGEGIYAIADRRKIRNMIKI